MGLVIMAMGYSKRKGIECMKDNLSRRRKKYALGLLAVTAATIGTSFSPSAPWVMASKTESDYGTPSNVPPVFNPPVYNELDFDPDENKIKAYYYHVQAGDNVTVTPNTFTEKDFDGNDVTFNNFIVKANDTLVEDSDDIVLDTGNSENTEKGKENGVTRKYKLTLSKALKDKIDKAATGGSSGGAAPSKLEDGTNTTVEGDGTDGNKYKVNLKSDVTNITSISGDATNGLTLHSGGDGTAGKTEVAVTNTGVTFTTKPAKGKGTTITINGNGIDVSSKKITGLGNGAIAAGSTDAVTGGQLHSTNTDVTNLRVTKLDKTAERHIKPGTYNVMNGTVTLEYVNGEGNATTEKAIINGIATKSDIWRLGIQNAGDTTTTDITPSTDGKVTLKAGDNVTLESNAGTVTISAKNKITSVTSGNLDALSVDTSNGAVTVNPVLASSISNRGDANKLVTAGVVSTAITNATNPLAKNDLSNIADAGKKVITGLGTKVAAGMGISVQESEDTTTGQKTYTVSSTAVAPKFANGTNTTLEGDGTVTSPYKYNVNPALTGITSITGDTGLTFIGAGTAVTINGNGVNVGGTRVTNLADADLSGSSTDAVTGKQLHTTNTKVTNLETTKLDKTAERHIKPSTYTVTNGSVTLNYVDGEGHDVADTTTINGVASTSDVWKLGIKNNGDKRATAITPTADGNVTLKAGDNVSLSSSNGEVTISAKNTVKSIISGDANTLTVTDNNGDVTLTPMVATDITSDGDKNKLVTAGVVNTAITNATSPLANKNLSNIADAGKKVITGLGTKVAAGMGISVQESEDTTTGQKTYTVSSTAVAPKFANGTNTTVSGDGSTGNEYSFDVNPNLTSITSVSGGTSGLTLKSSNATKGAKTEVSLTNGGVTFKSTPTTGDAKIVTINSNGIHAGDTKITGLENGAIAAGSKDAVTGDQLHTTNEKVESKLDKTAERHIKSGTYSVENGKVTLTYADGTGADVPNETAIINGVAAKSDLWGLSINNGNGATDVTPATGKVTLTAGDNIDIQNKNGTVTISAKDVVKSVTSATPDALTVNNTNGSVTVTANTAGDITKAADANKLVTASVVNTAITNATKPLADKNLSNITDAGKKMITGLGTKVVAGTGIDVQESEDTATGQKTYTVSSTAVAPKFANGTNTTVSGDGTEANKYTFNVSPTLTNITSVTGNTTSGLTLSSGGDTTTGKTELALANGGATFTSTSAGGTVKTVTINTTGINAGDTKITNLADGAISKDSKDAVNGSQLFNERVTSPVIFVDKDGNQVFKNADGKFVTKEGTEITDADELAKIHTKVNAANPMTLDNVASTIEDTTVPNAADPQNPTFKEKLTAAAGNDATKHAVVNVEDLHKATTSASDSTVAKGLDFYGDDTTTTGKVHRDLGTALKIQGADTYTRKATDTTGTTNISVTNNASGDGLNVAMANTLRGITSITNGDGATDVASTTMNITGDGVEITNTQPAANGNKASKTTVTIGKDGINAGGTKITNVAEGAINETSTDVVIGKQLHATNTDVANLKLTKLDKTDDVHVQAGEYAVNDKTGTVELTLAKGENDTDTGKKVKISGIVTHAVLSNTMDAYELNIEGDENTTNKNSLKKGVAVHGSSNFTPDEATKNAGINIQAKATDKGFDVKLSDTLTNMKGITFAPTTQGGASVSLTSTGLDNGGNTITNVAAGVNDTDAVNVSQLKNLAYATIAIDSRINRLGAQSAAMAGLRHLQYDPMEPTTLMAGVGTYKGQTALALGVAHYKNESLLFHAGASIGSDPNELMANAGVSWKFGSRSDESAVKDTYRQGPISSSYALQDKVAALEAQNQMQKEEINELKAQLAEVLQYIKKAN